MRVSASGPSDQLVEQLAHRLAEWLESTGLGTRSLWALEAGVHATETPGVQVRLEILVPSKLTDRGDIRIVMVE